MKLVRSFVYFGLTLLATMSSALADEQTAISGAGLVRPGDYLAQIMVSLLLVLLIIFFGAWLLRRFGRFASVADGKLMVLGAVSVGQRERIMLIQVGDDQLLIGVTSSKISTLHKLEQPVDLASEQQVNTVSTHQTVSFTKRLQDAIMQRKSSDQS
ncbi:flagellar biosynthetic protein FliO [Thiomicrospira microaerophila]|uniref:flagellar biosynthetic protein FliO n=1 Tax=Thiomicrospira microaerophila TaxID=406020 RepID=UPI00200F5529|nr:flagellar biosynthetic protein FliO [Thiomicrospira microaerophila]UQB41679.1 flagellar biosynthetic protein FliO [Thiomicrospira microaerophila]